MLPRLFLKSNLLLVRSSFTLHLIDFDLTCILFTSVYALTLNHRPPAAYAGDNNPSGPTAPTPLEATSSAEPATAACVPAPPWRLPCWAWLPGLPPMFPTRLRNSAAATIGWTTTVLTATCSCCR